MLALDYFEASRLYFDCQLNLLWTLSCYHKSLLALDGSGNLLRSCFKEFNCKYFTMAATVFTDLGTQAVSCFENVLSQSFIDFYP